MGQVAAGPQVGRTAGNERRPLSAALRSIVGFSPYIGAVAGLALLTEAAWFWYALEGRSAPASSAAYRDPLAAAFIGAVLLAFAATLFAGRSLRGRRGTMDLSVDVAVVLEFGLLTLVTWGLTSLGVTTNLPGSDYPEAARDMLFFLISFGLAFGAGLLMMLARITRN